ncbi:MAG TPA: hypothetical protein VGK10_21500 [Prolixibacteraceae bacterium]|jgi:hypothetical protein
MKIQETDQVNTEGWIWKPLKTGGILTIRHQKGNKVMVMGN